MPDLLTLEDVSRAAATIASHVVRTPSVKSQALSRYVGAPVTLKLETLQHTGSFKPRGIYNRLLCLSSNETHGLVTVSGGNHGIALAEIGAEIGVEVTVIMPRGVPEQAKAQVKAAGARLLQTDESKAAFELAEELGANEGLVYIHSYDDPLIIAGHGTVGLELLEDAPDLTDIIVSIGGGGLISGIATAAKGINPAVRIWGIEPVGAPTMSTALSRGTPTFVPIHTIATTLGAPTATEITLHHVRNLVERVFVASDEEALEGLRALIVHGKVWAEPAAAFTVVAAQRVVQELRGNEVRLGLVICGGNASISSVSRWLK